MDKELVSLVIARIKEEELETESITNGRTGLMCGEQRLLVQEGYQLDKTKVVTKGLQFLPRQLLLHLGQQSKCRLDQALKRSWQERRLLQMITCYAPNVGTKDILQTIARKRLNVSTVAKDTNP
jgi:hypothetical protein